MSRKMRGSEEVTAMRDEMEKVRKEMVGLSDMIRGLQDEMREMNRAVEGLTSVEKTMRDMLERMKIQEDRMDMLNANVVRQAKEIEKVKEENLVVRQKLQTVEDRLSREEEMKKGISEKERKLEERLATLKEMQKENNCSLNPNHNAEEIAREVFERDARQNNLIFFNLGESDAEKTADRIKHDEKLIQSTLDKIKVKEAIFETPIRLGKKGEKPRPIKIRFKEGKSCLEILKSARKLKGTEIFISKDMTPLERTEWKALLEERKRKRQESLDKGEDARWVIRNGKVINLAREEGQPTKKSQ